MKKLQQGASLTVQSNSKQFYSTCWLYAGTSESFKLSTYPNSNPSSVYGKNYSRNQKKREQLAASGVLNPVLNLTPSPTPAAIMGLSQSCSGSTSQTGCGQGNVWPRCSTGKQSRRWSCSELPWVSYY